MRRVIAVGLGLLIAAALVEVGLQIAAYVTWQRQTPQTRPTGSLLLCIGDSLTFGLGATDPAHAYPARLQQQLAERGSNWSVLHAALPGQSSADVLRRLPEQLRSLHPDAVCVLVGWNDGWARPARLDPVALGNSGFPLRWRTGRLLALMTAQPDDTIASQASVPFLGAWHVGEQEFVFSADGNVQFGGQPATWVVQGDTIRITPKGGSEFWI